MKFWSMLALSAFFCTLQAAPSGTKLAQIDRDCAAFYKQGDLESLQKKCAKLEPANHAIATYWRLRLATDPNDLRRGFAPSVLKAIDSAEPRLLLLAGKYHLARGQSKEYGQILNQARRGQKKSPELDTLEKLSPVREP